MPQVKRITPCSQCPFRLVSPPGWMGVATPQEFIEATEAEQHMPCHLEVDYNEADWHKQLGDVAWCAGSLIFLRNNCKMPLDKALFDAMQHVQADKERVFSFRHEFLEHHLAPWISGD